MFNRLLAVVATALIVGVCAFPASAANTFNVQVTAATSATVTVTGGTVNCDPGAAVTGNIACVNTINAAGNIRTTKAGTGSLTTSAVAITGTAGNSVPVAAVKMTCADNGSVGTHGVAVFAAASASAVAGVSCASWPGPNVFAYNVNLTFAIDASQVNADTYTLSSNWTVVAAAT